ncbi:MAG: PDZ domain-containing protein [Opitutaceae bacterium]|nr:PDZ domain-containing protein [Opitutaceae bacterium]
MKTILHHLAVALIAPFVLSPVHALAQETPKAEARREVRVLGGGPERRVFGQRGDQPEKMEKEMVAFLGVETGPVSATVAAQLGLARGTGLVVNQVVPKSPAADVLQEHDILLKLDDQILIESRQLAVLIRNRKQGDEVTLTYLRGGQKSTVKLTLGQHEVPKFSWVGGSEAHGFAFAPSTAGVQVFERSMVPPGAQREEVDHLLSMIDGARSRAASSGSPPVRIQIDGQRGPGFRAMSINTADSNLVFSDDEGSLELSQKAGVKSLVAKDRAGAVLFSGPVTTPDERKALPAAVRARLDRLEGMREMSFRTDGDFQGAETRMMRPLERSISFPRSPTQERVRAPDTL